MNQGNQQPRPPGTHNISVGITTNVPNGQPMPQLDTLAALLQALHAQTRELHRRTQEEIRVVQAEMGRGLQSLEQRLRNMQVHVQNLERLVAAAYVPRPSILFRSRL